VADGSPVVNAIYKYDSHGNQSLFTSSGIFIPIGLAFDGSGNLYVGNLGDNDVLKVTPQGQSSVIANYPAISGPQALAIDKNGNLYVANGPNNSVEKITPSGSASVFANTGFDTTPDGLAFDSSGNLYVACGASDTIEKFNPQGQGSVFASSGMNYPRGLAFDSSGNLYVANNAANSGGDGTIEKFNAQGQGTVFINGLSYPSYIAVLPVPEPSVWTFILLGLSTVVLVWNRECGTNSIKEPTPTAH
jgi:sugar lactone lactonase YvrE